MVVRVAGRAVVENAIAPTGNVVQPRHSAILQSGGHRVSEPQRSVCLANDTRLANDKHHTEVDDVFAQWESDPLQPLSFPDLRI